MKKKSKLEKRRRFLQAESGVWDVDENGDATNFLLKDIFDEEIKLPREMIIEGNFYAISRKELVIQMAKDNDLGKLVPYKEIWEEYINE